MGQPHDNYFQFTFRDPAEAACLLRGLLPPELAQLFADRELRPVPARSTGPSLRLNEGDLLFAADVHPCDAAVFVLFEHKAWADPGLQRQMQRYHVHLSGDHFRQHAELPVVLPIVVYTGRRGFLPPGWRTRAALRRLPQQLRGFDPQLRLHWIDLLHFREADLRARLPRPQACLTSLCLAHLPRRRQEAEQALLRWGDLITAVESMADGWARMEALSTYVLCVSSLRAEALAMLLTRILQKPIGSYVMSTASKLRAEGKREGIQEGKREARAEALAEARERLLRQLQVRFGEVDASFAARVAAAGPAELDAWSIRLLQADSLPAVFAS